MGFESPPGKRPSSSEELPPLELEDFADRPEVYTVLKRLPLELAERHFDAIDALDEDGALTYVQSLAERREAARKDFFVSDKNLRTTFEGHEKEIQDALETRVFNDRENVLGEGQTARVQRFQYEGQERPMAIKYLISPRENTLDVAEEHNLLAEVDQLQRIEEAEVRAGTEFVRVPHPYFYYRHGKVQCYGMEEVDGINLLKFREGECSPQMREDLRAAFSRTDRAALLSDVERFFTAMHQICIHNDIYLDRPGNLMASRDGKFYVIDFGESIAANTIDEQFAEMYDRQKEKELNAAKVEIGKFLDSLLADERQAA